MHLLAAQSVAPEDGDAAVDLGQTPGEIVVLSAADSELAGLAAARATLPADFPSLRLASLLRLAHPLSVDRYLDQVASHARLVLLRLLGGRSYWSYGLEQLAALARARGILLAVMPGDDQPDPTLLGWSTLDAATVERLWRHLGHGGPDNLRAALGFAARLLGRDGDWPEPRPMPAAGLYRPGQGEADLATLLARPDGRHGRAVLLFYRALLQAGDLAPVDALLRALDDVGLAAVGLQVKSLKDPVTAGIVRGLLAEIRPSVLLSTLGFALHEDDPLAPAGVPVLQAVLAAGSEEAWRAGSFGLLPRDLAMQVALPELDGRILARAVSFKAPPQPDPLTQGLLVRQQPVADRIAFTAALAAAWARLGRLPTAERRVAIVLANYPARDGRLANGVGLDTPASCHALLQALTAAGHRVTDIPASGDALIRALAAGPINAPDGIAGREIRARLPLADYRRLYAALPPAVRSRIEAQWGPPEADPRLTDGAFPLAILPMGHVLVGLQPARGYDLDPDRSYHSPDLAPPHAYLAFHLWLRHVWRADAMIQLGKHGNLEWLPGKSLALAEDCLPEAMLGPLPLLYPFIVNDPGEGTQAKRRASAVIIDHLTPPLTRAEGHGPMLRLERLLDEHYQAAALDPRRLPLLEEEIRSLGRALGLERDLALAADEPLPSLLPALDAHLCELKELQIRDGLHVLGSCPSGTQLADLLLALVRLPRGRGDGADASLIRALAADLGLAGFDPLATESALPWTGPRPGHLERQSPDPWRIAGDTVERLELLAGRLVAGEAAADPGWRRTAAVLDFVAGRLRPLLERSATDELRALLAGLGGRRVAPGASGAPTRGRLDMLPTGRNFFSIDARAVPTPAAWQLGWRSAEMLVEHYLQLHGDWPRQVALSAWGTSCMRTGGDDLAQALALMGCRPLWDGPSGRVTGIEVLPASVLGRPRVDVTLRVSGLFRDAFPHQLELLDDAVRAVAALDEPPEQNPLAEAVRQEALALAEAGMEGGAARRRASLRIFGSKPGSYGAGLQAPIDGGAWETGADLARVYLAWSGHAYGRGLEGEALTDALERRLARVDLVLHNQDNREHDLLDSDDYYQFEGGLTLAVRELSGRRPEIFHTDTSRPERPRVRRLQEEIGLVVRGRASNPKWLRGVMRHGYKGAFEIAATVDYLFAFAATAGVVEEHHFAALHDAYLDDPEVRAFLARHNPAALDEITARFAEAIRRGLWQPRRNQLAPGIAERLQAAPTLSRAARSPGG